MAAGVLTGPSKDLGPPYYYTSTFGMRLVLGRGNRPFLRFLVILGLLYSALFLVCQSERSLILPGASQHGLLEDGALYGIILFMLVGMGNLFYLLKTLDRFLFSLPDLVLTGGGDELNRAALEKQASEIREFIAARSRSGKIYYYAFMLFAFVLVLEFAVHQAFLDLNIRSWALWPQVYPNSWAIAVPWAFFWCFTLAHILWYILSISYWLFKVMWQYYRSNCLRVSPFAEDLRGGMGTAGDLAFAVVVGSSGGIFIFLPWLLFFDTTVPVAMVMALYGIGLGAVFFGTLWPVRQAMLRARAHHSEFLSSLVKRLDQHYLTAMASSSLRAGQLSADRELGGVLSELASVYSLHQQAEGMPTWPTSPSTRRAVTAVAASPVLAVGANVVSKDSLGTVLYGLASSEQSLLDQARQWFDNFFALLVS